MKESDIQPSPVTLNISGLKCDSCDYKNMSIQLEDYPNWVNNPCPKCGENLLTEADYESVQMMVRLTSMFQPMPVHENTADGLESKEEMVSLELKMDGSGEIKVKDEDVLASMMDTFRKKHEEENE